MTKIKSIAIIDYDVGNIRSLQNALTFLGAKAKLCTTEEEINKYDAIILPGVGAFDVAMDKIKAKNLDKILEYMVIKKSKPLLGICLGMQILATYSEENGIHQGLNWFENSSVTLIPSSSTFNVPHVGWSEVSQNGAPALFKRIKSSDCFYFDHSFKFNCNKKYISSECEDGVIVTASIQKDNIFGVQFHPERSHTAGLKLLKTFLTI